MAVNHGKLHSYQRAARGAPSEIVKESFAFKVENNSLELTRIFKENIMTDCEREKKV